MASVNANYGQNNPVAPITIPEVDQMRKRLLDNISDLNANKLRMHADEYFQLLNYHQYALTILETPKSFDMPKCRILITETCNS